MTAFYRERLGEIPGGAIQPLKKRRSQQVCRKDGYQERFYLFSSRFFFLVGQAEIYLALNNFIYPVKSFVIKMEKKNRTSDRIFYYF